MGVAEAGEVDILLSNNTAAPTSYPPSDAFPDPLSDFLVRSDQQGFPEGERPAGDLKRGRNFWGKIIIFF